jgi:hypothetical protein
MCTVKCCPLVIILKNILLIWGHTTISVSVGRCIQKCRLKNHSFAIWGHIACQTAKRCKFFLYNEYFLNQGSTLTYFVTFPQGKWLQIFTCPPVHAPIRIAIAAPASALGLHIGDVGLADSMLLFSAIEPAADSLLFLSGLNSRLFFSGHDSFGSFFSSFCVILK